MATIESIVSDLKAIAPHVLHREVAGFHFFALGDEPTGRRAFLAQLGVPAAALGDFKLSDDLLGEGRRLANSARQNV